MQRLQAQFPEGVAYKTTYDSTAFVLQSIDEVIHTLIEAFILVVIVVFLFLGNLRATLIPLIAVPVSLIGTFAVMLALGFSLNMVSLLALVLAIGIVVDDAIVVVEAVEANLEADHSLSPADAAKRAMGQITAPIIAITLVLLSVFVPVAFIPGISGQLYQQFAVAVAVSMVISAINALTLSPALCAVLLRHHAGPKIAPIRMVLGAIDFARDGYAAIVKRLVRVAFFSLVVVGGFLALNALAVQGDPRRLPAVGGPGRVLRRGAAARGRLGQPHRHGRRAGRGAAQGHSRASPTSARWSATARWMRSANPTAPTSSCCSSRSTSGPAPGEDVGSIIAKVRAEGAGIREANIIPFNVPPIIGLGTSGGFEYQLLDLQGGDPADLAAVARALIFAANQNPTADRRVHHLLGQHARSCSSTSTATRCRRWGSTSPTCSARCRRRSAAITSTISTCSAAPGSSTCRASRRTATRSTTSTGSTSAT